MIDEAAIRLRWDTVGSRLDERGRRLFAAAEVRGAGRGGLAIVSEITGLARSTINRGKNDLDGFVVDVSQEQRTTPYDTAIPPRESVLPPQEPAIGSSPLLLMLSLATLAIMCFVYLSPKENP